MYAFQVHYNRPASQRAGKNVITVHYRGACHLVHHLRCLVPTESRHRARQPRFVIVGRGVMTVSTLPSGERIAVIQS